MKTVRRLEFAHPGSIIDAAGFVQSRLLPLLCETHATAVYYQVPGGLPGRYHVLVETCCAAALARAAEALEFEDVAPLAVPGVRVAVRKG